MARGYKKINYQKKILLIKSFMDLSVLGILIRCILNNSKWIH